MEAFVELDDVVSRVEVVGSVQSGAPADWTPVVVHRSNPLPPLLRRFNVYSNNDIIRIAEGLGGPAGLETFLEQRLGLRAGERPRIAPARPEGHKLLARLELGR